MKATEIAVKLKSVRKAVRATAARFRIKPAVKTVDTVEDFAAAIGMSPERFNELAKIEIPDLTVML